MITLRGRLTRALVERKLPTPPPTLRSTAHPEPGPAAPPANTDADAAAAAAAAPAADAAGAICVSAAPAGTTPGVTEGATSTPVVGAVGGLDMGAEAKTAAHIEALGLVEEWTWRGVWAFGDLPEDEEEKSKKESKATDGVTGDQVNKDADKNATSSSTPGGGDGTGATKETTDQQPTTTAAAVSTTDDKTPAATSPPPPKKRPGRPPKEPKVKPRPFTYRWLKAKDAGGVIVPSSLVIMAAAVDEEERKNAAAAGGDKVGASSEGSAVASGTGSDKDKVVAENASGEKVSVSGSGGNEKPEVTAAATATTGDAAMGEAATTIKESQTTAAPDNATDGNGDAVMKDAEGGSNKTDAAAATTSNQPTAATDTTTPKPAAETPNENPTPPPEEPTFTPPTTFGEPPYADAGLAYPLGTCPNSGKWEGHFENVVPNTSSSKKKRRDKRDNRIREMFYLFFNATPPLDAREAFVDSDSTIAANRLLDDRSNTSVADKDDAADGNAEVEKLHLLKEEYIHVRGYGTNRFGTFEIVGSLNPKTGVLQCQRMYVPVPTAADISKATGQRRSTSGRFLSGLDLTIPGEDEGDRRRGSSNRKRKSTWKKRDMDSSGLEVGVIGADGALVTTAGAGGGAPGGIDIASIVKKRSRLSNENMGSTRAATPGGGGAATKPLPQCRAASFDHSSLKVLIPPAGTTMFAAGTKPSPSPRAPPARAASVGSGKKASKKKKVKVSQPAPAPQSYKGPMPGGSVAPPVSIIPTLPTAGDPYLARWRAAHYLYYQRVEQEPEGEGLTSANPSSTSTIANAGTAAGSNSNNTLIKINFVIYEGEMHDGVREGRGICLYNNNTLYEGQWKKNKEHGIGTLMTSDRRRIIYAGAWEKGKMHGHGSYHYYIEKSKTVPKENGRYVGQFRQNLRNGHGVYTLPDGCIYDGEWRENIQNGWGVFRWMDGSVYEGQWKDGRRHGASGILMASDGFRYEGAWVKNTMEGRGVATYPKGQVYDGTWVAGKREGRGTIRFTNGAVYEGRFKEDYMEGQGTMKMNRNVIIPKIAEEDEHGRSKEALPSNSKNEAAHDWMIPLQFQSDISHIHQKAGFTQIGL